MATLSAQTQVNMASASIFYGTITSYDATHIAISNGYYTGVYLGSFYYDAWGLTGGTLTGYRYYEGGVLKATVSGASANAVTYANYLDANNLQGALSYVFRSADTMNGSAYSDVLLGYGGNDVIRGNGGNDVINGGPGNDTLYGNPGNDVLIGGSGKDVMAGGGGKDYFDFNAVNESAASINRDVINSFDSADVIDVSTIDAKTTVAGNQAFTFARGADFNGTFNGTGKLFYETDTHILWGNNDGDAQADFSIKVNLSGISNLTAADFVL